MNQLSVSADVSASKTIAMLKPTSEIAKIMSNEEIKKLELSEYCKIVEGDLKVWQKKIQAINSAINENIRIKDEYKSRNRINVINSESLLQALNELNKYKCELKSVYIASEKAFKTKTLKYKNIISAYDSAWKSTLEEYNRSPMFVELLKYQQENTLLEKKVEKQEKLRACTENQLILLKDRVQQEFLEKIVEFSKVMIQYKDFVHSSKRNKENKFEDNNKNLKFKIFKTDAPNITGKPMVSFDSNDEANINCSVDISIFDDIMVPSENLESQILEEDVLMRQDGYNVSKDQEEELEYLNNYQQIIESSAAKTAKNAKVDLIQERAKSVTRVENESQYFKQTPSEQTQNETLQDSEKENLSEENFFKQGTNEEKLENVGGVENPKSASANTSPGVLQQAESEDEVSKDVQMEYDESLSEESYEKQFANQRENYERQYQKTSSVSSDDLAPTGDNPNENVETCKTSKSEQRVSFNPRREPGKNDFKSFTGFFTMGNDNEPPTPSIFKLF